jgi:hypothetical protein
LKRLRLLFAVYLLTGWLFISPAHAEGEATPEPAVTVIVTAGGDDVSYQVPLQVSVVYDDVTYSNVYATTNSVITFGNPDGTYWTYPNTPSVSIESRDWWALPQQMPDTHFIISVSEGGFQVDGAYRPFGTMTGEVTNIVITAQITTSGEVEYTYSVQGPLYGGERTGARLNDGTVVPLAEIGITEVEEPVELAPEPVPPTPEPEPTPVEPEPVTPVEPVVVPPVVPVEPPVITPEIVIPYIPPQIIVIDTNPEPLPTTEGQEPEPPIEEPLTDEESAPVDESVTEEIQEQPTQEEVQENQSEEPSDTPVDEITDEPTTEIDESQEPMTAEQVDNLVDELTADGTLSEADREVIAEALVEASEGEPITAETIEEAGLTYEDLPPSTPVEVRQDSNGNAVVITAEVAAALVVLDSPVELLNTIFSDPAQALLALSSIGADMSDEERAESEQTIVAAVIVSGIAVQSAASAAIAGSATYRRRV